MFKIVDVKFNVNVRFIHKMTVHLLDTANTETSEY